MDNMAGDRLSGSAWQRDTLVRANIQDFLASFGLEDLRRGRKLLEALCWLPARRFAAQMMDYDRRVGGDGLHRASQYTLSQYVSEFEIAGGENLPAEGPLLLLSNHPGLADTLILFSSLPRSDLRIVGTERPFLNALVNVSRHMAYVPDDPGKRMGVVRMVGSHLRQGGSVLTFPAGEIEPDPASMPGALESLERWSESVAVFARLAPETRIVVAIVSGVIWPATLRHPLTRLRKQRKDQERIAASLQVLAQTLRPSLKPVATRVAFSPALPAGELAASGAAALKEAVAAQARRLILAVQPRESEALRTLKGQAEAIT
jgi:hypothetical protein